MNDLNHRQIALQLTVDLLSGNVDAAGLVARHSWIWLTHWLMDNQRMSDVKQMASDRGRAQIVEAVLSEYAEIREQLVTRSTL